MLPVSASYVVSYTANILYFVFQLVERNARKEIAKQEKERWCMVIPLN